uniref:Uncharacterized protein n=1 Tax=viral metagenome TaxID=1070528 RepID=A0A6C0EDN0_9ZZZZ
MINSESSKLNNEVFQNIKISSQEYTIIKTIEAFYENEENVNLFCSIINSESDISIRLIDHFVTKYAKNHKTCYKIKENNTEQIINIYTSYKQQLKAYQKKNFDPFSRGDRIPYFLKNNCVITTIGQLNFFKWFFSKKIYNYIKNNKNNIEIDMNKKNKMSRKNQDKKNISIKNNNYSNNKLIIIKKTSIKNINQFKKDKIIVSFE